MEQNNPLSEYRYCGNIQRYLMEKLKGYGKGVKELTVESGYALSNIAKFKEHCVEWSQLLRPIPKAYFESIGGRIEDIEQLLVLEIKDFEEACQLPRQVDGYLVRYMCAVYGRRKFDPTISEEEAIMTLQKHPEHRHLKTRIDSNNELVLVGLEPDGEVWKSFREPYFKVSKAHITFPCRGVGGRSYINGREIEWQTLLSL